MKKLTQYLTLVLFLVVSTSASAGLITATETSRIDAADLYDPINDIVLQEYLDESGNGGDKATHLNIVDYVSLFTVNSPANYLTFRKTDSFFEYNMTVQFGNDPSNAVSILWDELKNDTHVAFFSDIAFTDVRVTHTAITSKHGEFIKNGIRIENIFTDSNVIAVETPTDVPEPSSLAIFGLGLLGFAGAKRLKNTKVNK